MPEHNNIQKIALKTTRWVGSPTSIIAHTLIFAASFVAVMAGFVSFDRMLLILTTVVSLEAIYLAIFIQMTINYQGQSIAEVQEDVEEIQEDVGEIQEDVEEMSEDVDELQEDVEEMSEEETVEIKQQSEQKAALSAIQQDLQRLLADVERLKITDIIKDGPR